MDLITAEWCREQGACYDDLRLARLFDRPHTLREVMTRADGRWASVPARDRVWVACRALPARQARLFACKAAERALLRERDAGREPHADSWRAIEVARRHANGQATDGELAAAREAATAVWNAAALEPSQEAAWAAAAAASRMAKTAARAAAWTVAAHEAAAGMVAVGAVSAARASMTERRAQVADVLAVLDDLEQ